jgi:hypothetical protein
VCAPSSVQLPKIQTGPEASSTRLMLVLATESAHHSDRGDGTCDLGALDDSSPPSSSSNTARQIRTASTSINTKIVAIVSASHATTFTVEAAKRVTTSSNPEPVDLVQACRGSQQDALKFREGRSLSTVQDRRAILSFQPCLPCMKSSPKKRHVFHLEFSESIYGLPAIAGFSSGLNDSQRRPRNPFIRGRSDDIYFCVSGRLKAIT